LALKSNLPSAGLVAVGMPTQVASCAKTGDVPAKAPIRLAAIAAARHAAPLNFPATFPNAPSSNRSPTTTTQSLDSQVGFSRLYDRYFAGPPQHDLKHDRCALERRFGVALQYRR